MENIRNMNRPSDRDYEQHNLSTKESDTRIGSRNYAFRYWRDMDGQPKRCRSCMVFHWSAHRYNTCTVIRALLTSTMG